MPELQQKLESLQKLETYLKQQVSELEEDRQQLYDLLRDDKKTIHELKIKLRSMELSEDNHKSQLEQLSDAETKLLEENEVLENKLKELQLQAKRHPVDNHTETIPYESETEKSLKEELEKLKVENRSLNEKLENIQNNKIQLMTKSSNTDKEFPAKDKDAGLLQQIEEFKEELEREKEKYTRAQEEVGRFKEEVLKHKEKERTDKHRLESLELQLLQESVKAAALEKQLKELRRAPPPQAITEVVENSSTNKEKEKKKLMDNLASIMAGMDDPNYQNKDALREEASSGGSAEEVKKLRREIQQLRSSHKLQLEEKEEEMDEILERLKRGVAEKGREKELMARVDELEERLKSKAGSKKSVQTDEPQLKVSSVKIQSDESFFEQPASKRAETQTSTLNSPDASNASMQTEDVEVREVSQSINRGTQTTFEDESRYTKSRLVQTEDAPEKLNKAMQVDLEEPPVVPLKTVGVQTSLEDDAGEELLRLRRSLLNAEKEMKLQAQEVEDMREDLQLKDKKLKELTKDSGRQVSLIEDLSSDKKALSDKYAYLLEAGEQERRANEEEMEGLKTMLDRKKKQIEEMEKEKEEKFSSFSHRLKKTEGDLLRAEQRNLTQQEEQTGIAGKQTAEIEALKQALAEKEEEVRCLWTDLNKIQKNYTNYVDASEKDCLSLEERVRKLEELVKNGEREVETLNDRQSKCQERLKRKEDECDEVVEKQKKTSTEFSALKRVVAAKEEEARLLVSDLNSLQMKFALVSQDHENCDKNDWELRRECEEYRGEMRQMREEGMEQTRQLELKKNKLKIYEANKQELEEKNRELETEIDHLKDRLQKAELQNDFLTSSNQHRLKMAETNALREKKANVSNESVQGVQIAHLKKSLENKDEEVRLLTEDLNHMHARYMNLLQKSPNEGANSSGELIEKQVARLRSELERKERENTALLRNHDSLNTINQQTFAEKEKSKKDFMREKGGLLEELKEKTKMMSEKERLVDVLSRQVEELQSDNEKLAETCSDLKMKLNQVANSLKASSMQNKELLTQCKSDQQTFQKMEDKEREQAFASKRMELELASLQQQLHNSQKALKDMSENHSRVSEQLARTKKDLLEAHEAAVRAERAAKLLQEKDKQLMTLREQLREERRQREDLQDDSKQHQQTQNLFQLLRKEYEDLATHSKKQSLKVKELQANEKILASQLKEKDSELRSMNAELGRCSELSRKLGGLSTNR